MNDAPDQAREAFRRRFGSREFKNVAILDFGEWFDPDDLKVLSAGVTLMVGARTPGFVFELSQFCHRGDLEHRLEHVVQCMVVVYRSRGSLNWLHGAPFVEEWRRLKLLGIPPSSFETETEAIEDLQNLLEESDVVERLTRSSLSARKIANQAGLFEEDVHRIAAGRQRASPKVLRLITSALESLEPSKKPPTAV